MLSIENAALDDSEATYTPVTGSRSRTIEEDVPLTEASASKIAKIPHKSNSEPNERYQPPSTSTNGKYNHT